MCADDEPRVTLEHEHEGDICHNIFPFLKLPPEIRIMIYDLLLVRRSKRQLYNTLLHEKTTQRKVQMSSHGWHHNQTRSRSLPICSSILKVCKQVHHEALPVLYSHNMFQMKGHNELKGRISRFSEAYIGLIRVLDIELPWNDDVIGWLGFFETLACRASGLKVLRVWWTIRPESSLPREGGRGLGCDLGLVWALSRISGLKMLVLGGYYAKEWPNYLRTSMTCCIVTQDDIYGKEVEVLAQDPTPGNVQQLQAKADRHRTWRRNIMEYQQGTENIIP
jgi:hypothetical protein